MNDFTDIKNELASIHRDVKEGFVQNIKELGLIKTDIALIQQSQQDIKDKINAHDNLLSVHNKELRRIENRHSWLMGVTVTIGTIMGILLFALKSYIINVYQEQQIKSGALAQQVVQAIEGRFPDSTIEANND